MHVLNRAQVLQDAFKNFDENGSSKSLDIVLRLTNYLSKETDYIAWYPGYAILSHVKHKLAGTEFYRLFKVRSSP